jgi:beta-N-acetylhexosaminidase
VEEAILRTYGPGGTAQIDPEDITSLPFGQLKKLLAGEEVQYDVSALLGQADWILFAQQDMNPVKGPNSDAAKLFLNHGSSASYQARLVVLAFNAPYYLDTTEISKLDLYLGTYSKARPFVEAAVRALFGELVPRGRPPVDVEGINYDLSKQLSPDPGETIPLVRLEPAAATVTQPPVGVRLQAGPILDRNGHIVPDGTQVTFYTEYSNSDYAPSRSATTVEGLAETAFDLAEAGQVLFRVESGDARHSQAAELLIQPLPTETPTPPPTQTSTPTLTPSPLPTATPPASATPVPSPTASDPIAPSGTEPSRPVDGLDLMLAIGIILLIAAAGCLLLDRRMGQREVVLRWSLLAVIGGLTGYILCAWPLLRPASWGILPEAAWVSRAVTSGIAAVGTLAPLAIAILTTAAWDGESRRVR